MGTSARPRDLRRKTRREALVQIRSRFIAGVYPRLTVLAFIGLSGGAALGVSAALFRLGVEQMGYRYAVATMAGYAVFLLLIKLWIEIQRPQESGDWDLLDVPDATGSGDSSAGFSGGVSGGGGASGNWGPPDAGLDVPLDALDADEAWPVVVAIVVTALVLVGSLAAMLYVVYYAPVLLAEIALDAALVTGIYRRLRRQDTRHWLESAIGHTWKPAIVIMVCLFVAGTVIQWAIPSARTIGDLLR